MRRYREVQCSLCKEYFDTTKYTSCPKEKCRSLKEIRHMTKEERHRAKEKERANKCTQSNLKKTPQ